MNWVATSAIRTGSEPLYKLLLHLPLEQFLSLQRLAQVEGNSIASLIRRAIAQFLISQPPG